ncbi:MAG: TIGR01777 family oxidoreductase [Acidobacteriota bacterium]|nr:TIGR01777 family oxidoreductase [Acidobacteriota bacterium]
MQRNGKTGTVVLSGASGFLGSALREQLVRSGYATLQLVRSRQACEGRIYWNPSAVSALEKRDALEGCSMAVHLSGASVAGKRWTTGYRQELVESRVATTATLARVLAELKSPPATLVVASAVGFYGDRGDEVLDENSAKGSGFLADLCEAWEEASLPAAQAGIRVVHARLGIVLSKKGGALRKMLPAFRFGVGGRLGSGQQWVSWVSLEDAVDALQFLMHSIEVSGAVNVTAPNPVTNSEFTQALAQKLHRPALFPVPAFALRLAFGRAMADEALLASQRAVPLKLRSSGFRFRHARLQDALRAALE